MEHYNQTDLLSNVISYGNSSLTCLFLVEMVLKIIGLGFKTYVRDGFNDFDAIVVIFGLLEFINVGSKAITVFRVFRMLRIFKIVKSWKILRKLLVAVFNSFASIANLALLVFLFVFIYALIGMQFFSGPIPDYPSFRYGFNTFGYALIAIFDILSSENWNN
jgi:hypothetical protein